MVVYDSRVKEQVDVADRECLTRDCYWPLHYPGAFTYRKRKNCSRGWLCGTREANGCPVEYDLPDEDGIKHDQKIRMAGAIIKAGDTVLHRPSGETWTVLRVSGDRLYPAGWPASSAFLSDCELISVKLP